MKLVNMFDGVRINKIEHGKQVITKADTKSGGVAFYDGASATPADVEARQWIDAVLNDKQPTVLPEQALVVSQILEAIYESARTGKTIEF